MPKCAVLRIPEVEPEPTFSYPEGLWKGDGQGACRTSALENSKVLYGNFSGSTCTMTNAVPARKPHLTLVSSNTENQDATTVSPGITKELYRTFSSQELDQETGLYYFGARYYNPRTSVWQSPDPALGKFLPNTGFDNTFKFKREPDWNWEINLSGKGGVYNSTNLALYGYVSQNPLIYTDPDGNVHVRAALGAGIGIVGNGAGLVVGGFLLLAPEPTLLTKVAGTVVTGKSLYGLGVNSANFYRAFKDESPVSTGSLFGDVAQKAVPGSKLAQGTALGLDITTDLLSGNIAEGAAKSSLGIYKAGSLLGPKLEKVLSLGPEDSLSGNLPGLAKGAAALEMTKEGVEATMPEGEPQQTSNAPVGITP